MLQSVVNGRIGRPGTWHDLAVFESLYLLREFREEVSVGPFQPLGALHLRLPLQ